MAAPSSEIKVYAISKEPGQRIFDMIVYGHTGPACATKATGEATSQGD